MSNDILQDFHKGINISSIEKASEESVHVYFTLGDNKFRTFKMTDMEYYLYETTLVSGTANSVVYIQNQEGFEEKCDVLNQNIDYLDQINKTIVFTDLGRVVADFMNESAVGDVFEYDHEELAKVPAKGVIPMEEMLKALNIQPNSTNIGRNEPCFCGSGKKYKKCCLNK